VCCGGRDAASKSKDKETKEHAKDNQDKRESKRYRTNKTTFDASIQSKGRTQWEKLLYTSLAR
jgi:hypothetical protein